MPAVNRAVVFHGDLSCNEKGKSVEKLFSSAIIEKGGLQGKHKKRKYIMTFYFKKEIWAIENEQYNRSNKA